MELINKLQSQVNWLTKKIAAIKIVIQRNKKDFNEN